MSRPVNAPVQRVRGTELRAALTKALSAHFGKRRSIVTLERHPSAYRSSFAIEELHLCLEDGTTLHLMFKDLSRQALLEGARLAKPAFLYDPLREIQTYRAILASEPLGAATCYGAALDPQAGRYWLFLEKVPGVELYQVGEFGIWQQVVCWLAAMHARFAGQAESLKQAAHLLTYDGDFYQLWMRRARAFLGQTKPSVPMSLRRRFERLAEGYDRVVESLLGLPVTFIHGEFYASNVLVQETGGELRVCPVDWEMAALGPGLIDLAALTTGRWTKDQRRSLALNYYAAIRPNDR